MTVGGVVYIMTNKHHRVTSDLIVRVQQHIAKEYTKSFTCRYNATKLVYYKTFPSIIEAIAEEKRIKGGSRQKKLNLINDLNPSWEDLWLKEVSLW